MEMDRKTLRWRFLLPLYLSNVAEGICLTVTMFFIPLHVRRTFGHTSLLTIASIVALPSGAMFIASNFWGALADYTKKLKPYLLIGLAGYGGCLYALSASHTTVEVVLVATISSLFFAALRPISLSYVTLLRETEKGRAIGDLMAYQSLGWLVGGIAGGYLFEPVTGAPVKSILVGGAIFGASVLALVAALLRPLAAGRSAPPNAAKGTADACGADATTGCAANGLTGDIATDEDAARGDAADGCAVNPRDHDTHSWFQGMTADLRMLYSSRALVATCILAGLCSGGVWVFFGNFSVFLTEHIKASTTLLGWAMALSTLLGMFTFGPSGRLVDRMGPMRVLIIAVVSYAIVYGLVSLTGNPILITVYFCVPIYPLFNVSVITLTSELSGKSTRTGGLGVLAGVLAFALAAGTLVGGAIADNFGLAVLPRCTFGLEIACLVAILASVKLFRVLTINAGRRGFVV